MLPKLIFIKRSKADKALILLWHSSIIVGEGIEILINDENLTKIIQQQNKYFEKKKT